jgi:hypothetical protein
VTALVGVKPCLPIKDHRVGRHPGDAKVTRPWRHHRLRGTHRPNEPITTELTCQQYREPAVDLAVNLGDHGYASGVVDGGRASHSGRDPDHWITQFFDCDVHCGELAGPEAERGPG